MLLTCEGKRVRKNGGRLKKWCYFEVALSFDCYIYHQSSSDSSSRAAAANVVELTEPVHMIIQELEQLEDENQKKQVVKVIRTKEEAGGGENNSWDDDDPRKMKDNNVFGDRQLFAMYFFKARKLTVQR